VDGQDDELCLLAPASPLLPVEVIPPEPRLAERLAYLLPLGGGDEALPEFRGAPSTDPERRDHSARA